MANPVWSDIGALDQIPRRGARIVRTPKGCVAVFRTQDDKIFALEDRCPHKGGPLSQGIVHGSRVTCPLHNWVISLETGAAEGADVGQTQRFPLRVVDGRLLIDRSPFAGAPDLKEAGLCARRRRAQPAPIAASAAA
jgi:nitrite reductase (NADH) small subunit